MTDSSVSIVFLVFLVVVTLILRSAARAARKSEEEEVIRKMVQDHLRKRRLDKLYGRDTPPEGR